jgi:hypothetical protein
MLVYEDCRHEESAPQVRAIERAVKKSSEGQRLNKLFREKNVDGHLPRSVGEYMNAAEDLDAEAETALRKARKYTDAAGGKTSAPGTGVKRRQQASAYKKKCHGCGMFDHVHQDCFYRTHPYFYKDPTIEYAQSPVGIRYYNKYGGGISKNATWIQLCTRMIAVQACCENGHVWKILPGFRVNLLVENGRYRAVESPPKTVAAIPRSGLTLPYISRRTNAIVGSVSRIRTPAVKSSMSSLKRQ